MCKQSELPHKQGIRTGYDARGMDMSEGWGKGCLRRSTAGGSINTCIL